MKRSPYRAALISLPWADHQFPSLPIGALASFAQLKGFKVDALHLHLDIALRFGIPEYELYAYDHQAAGEAIFAAALHPASKSRILRSLQTRNPHIATHFPQLLSALKTVYDSIEWKHYHLVGFSATYQQLFPSLLFAHWLKRDFPHIQILLGGKLVESALGLSVLKHYPQVDWCIQGEGELPFVDLLAAQSTNRPYNISQIAGLMYRKSKHIICNPTTQMESLKALPDPDYEHYFQQLATHPLLQGFHIRPGINIEESRGCRFHCAFCSETSYWRGQRHRPAKEILKSIDRLCKKHQTCSIYLVASNLSPKSCAPLFETIASSQNDQRLYCQIRCDLTKRELRLMKSAGVTEVQIGIEALDTKLLRKMNKASRLIDNLKILKFCEEVGIRHSSNLIIGFPTESSANLANTIRAIDYACSYFPPSNLAPYQLRMGSITFENPKRFGICSIQEQPTFIQLLAKQHTDELIFWLKSFSLHRQKHNYHPLEQRLLKWKQQYESSLLSGIPLLYYLDGHSFVQIEDSRSTASSLYLTSWARDLYLFCDEIRSFQEIRERFKEVPEKELRKVLHKLFKLKVMYTEDDDWLSLAIHASPENRRHMPFL